MWSDRWHVERGHNLLPTEIGELIPALYSQEDEPDKMAYAMLFSPINGWRWFITEWEPREGECFGLVFGYEREWGYFSLEELASVRHLGILAIARFQAFKPARLSALDLRLG